MESSISDDKSQNRRMLNMFNSMATRAQAIKGTSKNPTQASSRVLPFREKWSHANGEKPIQRTSQIPTPRSKPGFLDPEQRVGSSSEGDAGHPGPGHSRLEFPWSYFS